MKKNPPILFELTGLKETREITAMIAGVSMDVVKPLVTMYNARQKPTKESAIGRPKRVIDESLAAATREIVMQWRTSDCDGLREWARNLIRQRFKVHSQTLEAF